MAELLTRENIGPPDASSLYDAPPSKVILPDDYMTQVMALPPDQQRKALEARIEYLKRRAPFDLEAHAQLVHKDDRNQSIVPAKHHSEWIRILEDRETFPWVCIVVPPGYGKSTWVSVIYPAWRLGATKGKIRIGIVSNAGGQAAAFAGAVSDTVETQAFQGTYPDVRPDKKRGFGRSRFYVTGAPTGPNPSVLSSGIGGVSVLGKRFDEIILDDPTTWENARSQTVMDGQRHFLKTTLISRFPPGMGPPDGRGGRMIVVCTRWAENDLVPTLEELGFKVIRMPALGYWDGQGSPTSKDFIPGTDALWPERESQEQLESLREDDPLVFALVMQGDPSVLSGDTFDPAWFRCGTPPPRSAFKKVVQFVDTAGGRDRKKGDFFAMATIGLLTDGVEEPQYWVLHMDKERISSLRQFDRVKRNHMLWESDLVTVEDMNEGRALYDRMVAETNIPTRRMKPITDKEFRALPLAGKYRAGLVYHPEGERWVRGMEAELEAFPNSEHDDQVDALSGAFNSMNKRAARVRVLG